MTGDVVMLRTGLLSLGILLSLVGTSRAGLSGLGMLEVGTEHKLAAVERSAVTSASAIDFLADPDLSVPADTPPTDSSIQLCHGYYYRPSYGYGYRSPSYGYSYRPVYGYGYSGYGGYGYRPVYGGYYGSPGIGISVYYGGYSYPSYGYYGRGCW